MCMLVWVRVRACVCVAVFVCNGIETQRMFYFLDSTAQKCNHIIYRQQQTKALFVAFLKHLDSFIIHCDAW